MASDRSHPNCSDVVLLIPSEDDCNYQQAMVIQKN
jgi:hypothetical protein